jgi:hypothetical protein
MPDQFSGHAEDTEDAEDAEDTEDGEDAAGVVGELRSFVAGDEVMEEGFLAVAEATEKNEAFAEAFNCAAPSASPTNDLTCEPATRHPLANNMFSINDFR